MYTKRAPRPESTEEHPSSFEVMAQGLSDVAEWTRAPCVAEDEGKRLIENRAEQGFLIKAGGVPGKDDGNTKKGQE